MAKSDIELTEKIRIFKRDLGRKREHDQSSLILVTAMSQNHFNVSNLGHYDGGQSTISYLLFQKIERGALARGWDRNDLLVLHFAYSILLALFCLLSFSLLSIVTMLMRVCKR